MYENHNGHVGARCVADNYLRLLTKRQSNYFFNCGLEMLMKRMSCTFPRLIKLSEDLSTLYMNKEHMKCL
jgi:hypothetical protein